MNWQPFMNNVYSESKSSAELLRSSYEDLMEEGIFRWLL